MLHRREVLELSGIILGGDPIKSLSVTQDQDSPPDITGRITKGDRERIVDRKAKIEAVRYSGATLCNTGELYECATCDGVEFYLLVKSGTAQPTVGATYQFEFADEKNTCRNFGVQLREAKPCENAQRPATEATTTTETSTETTSETTTDTPTTTTETTTTETTTTETTTTDTTTTETTTDTPTTTTETPSTRTE